MLGQSINLSAFSGQGTLDDHRDRLKDIAKKLDHLVNIHVVRRLEDNHDEVMEALRKMDEHSAHSQSSSFSMFQSIVPPPPADFFTGREDYLTSMENNFEIPKTSVEMGVQRRFVLYGIGGIGKTQVALKFVDKNRERLVIDFQLSLSMTQNCLGSR